tara:strand:- start:185 stop:484 length:300 start_codon:yes stop_codon:yes gene_type:complete
LCGKNSKTPLERDGIFVEYYFLQEILKKMAEKKSCICPKCHEMYYETPEAMLEHIMGCKDDSDVITTKWYTHEELKKKYNDAAKEVVISSKMVKRPQTR